MAKAGFIMQGGRGKIGNVVLYKGEKGTLQRELVAPRNAKTAKQMAQRIIFATVNQAAAWMKSLVNHSFENVPEGEKSVREFTRLNLSLLRNYAADDFANTPDAVDAKVFTTTKGISTLIPNRYIVSKGTLLNDSAFSPSWVANDIGTLTLRSHHKHFEINCTTTAISEGENPEATEVEVKALDLLNILGIHSLNDQLSMVCVGVNKKNILFQYGDDAAVPGFVIKQGLYQVVRAVPNPALTDSSKVTIALEKDGEDVVGTISRGGFESMFDLTKSDGDFLQWINESLFMDISEPEASPVIGGTGMLGSDEADSLTYWEQQSTSKPDDYFSARMVGIIRSSYNATSNKWLRSTCVLEGQGPVDTNNYGLIWAVTNDAWNRSVEIAANNLFLDQGGKGGTIE